MRGREFGDQLHTFSRLSILHNTVVAWNTIQIGKIVAICTHPPEKVKSAYLLIAKTHSMFERMLLYMLYLCCVTGTDPAVLRAEAVALA